MAIASAGTWPDRFAAVCSFHSGNLATDAPDSPHCYAPRLKAELYVAVAEADPSYPPAMAERPEAAPVEGGVRYGAETYSAAHGWMKPDFPVYGAEAADRGWREMPAVFDRILKRQ